MYLLKGYEERYVLKARPESHDGVIITPTYKSAVSKYLPEVLWPWMLRYSNIASSVYLKE
jgi:hypothetical protein